MDILDPLPCSLRQLQYIVAVADLGGFGRAAARCHVSQPSLSAQIALAERALHVRIFERDRRAVRLTSAGAVIVDRATQVLIAARDLADAARHQADPFQGELRIGVIPTVCPYLLPEIAPALASAYPHLSIAWTEDKTTALMAQMREGALDAAVLATDTPAPGCEQVTLTVDTFVLAASPGHPLVASSRPLDPARLEGEDVLLLADGHCFRNQALALCARAGAATSGYGATSLSTLVQMVASGSRVTLLPSLAVPVENRRGQLAVRPFIKPTPGRTLALVWRRGAATKTTLEAVATTIREAIASPTGHRDTETRRTRITRADSPASPTPRRKTRAAARQPRVGASLHRAQSTSTASTGRARRR